MSLFKAKKLSFLAAGITVVALFAAQGCSSDDDSQAAPPTAGAGGGHAAGSAGKSGSGNGESGATNSNGGSGNTGNTGNSEAGVAGVDNNGEAGAAGAAPVEPGCVDATGCYSCVPKTNDQFLNQCVSGGCPAHFDNTTLTKLDKVGTL
jgi:hypothetical protein